MKKKEIELNLGDLVMVINKDDIFDTYDTWASENNLKNWVNHTCPKEKRFYLIIAKAPHTTYYYGYGIIYGIEDLQTKEHFIMLKTGLKNYGNYFAYILKKLHI